MSQREWEQENVISKDYGELQTYHGTEWAWIFTCDSVPFFVLFLWAGSTLKLNSNNFFS